MSTSKSSRKSTAAVFALALALAGSTAQADTLFSVGSVPVRAEEPSTGFLNQAWIWVADVWTGWFGVATEKETTTATQSESNTCTTQTPCDPNNEAGWGIDPNG